MAFIAFLALDKLASYTKSQLLSYLFGSTSLKEITFFSALSGAIEGVDKYVTTKADNDEAVMLNKYADNPNVKNEINLRLNQNAISNSKDFHVPLSTTDKIFGATAIAGLGGALATVAIPIKNKTFINTSVGSILLGGFGYIASRFHSTNQALKVNREQIAHA